MKKKQVLKAFLGMIAVSSIVFAQESIKPTGCKGPVLCPTMPVDPAEGCCKRWHVDIGLLYQQPAFTGMISGYEYQPFFYQEDPEGDEFQNQVATTLQECLDYALGLTLSLGCFTGHDDWYMGAKFDYVSAKVYKRHNFDSPIPGDVRPSVHMNPNIYAGLNVEFDTARYDEIQYNANFDVYSLDVLLSRGAYHSKSFSFEPFAGVQALWFFAKQNAQYLDFHYSEGDEVENVVQWQEKEQNWGAGPMAGVNLEYHCRKEISVFSDSEIAVLYGEARTYNETEMLPDPNEVEVGRTIEEVDLFSCQPYCSFRSILGVKFDCDFLDPSVYLALKIGYDLRVVISYPNDENGFAMGGLYTNLAWFF